MREKLSRRLLGGSPSNTLFTSVMLSLAFVAMAWPGGATGERQGRTPAQQGLDPAALMTRGKLEVDLGDYAAASETFSSVAGDESAPDALRWEALARLGLARLAAGDPQGGADAFKEVTRNYSDDPDAIRFLISAVASDGQGKVWLDLKPQFEELLRSADVASVEEIGMGVRGLKRVYLAEGEIELSGFFRPASLPNSPAVEGLYEVAAYEMDKLLGLDMVPPAVERMISTDVEAQIWTDAAEGSASSSTGARLSDAHMSIGERGSLQLWVEGVMQYQGLEAQASTTPGWGHELSRIKTFDNLIGNRDRNLGNILIAPDWGAVLIDHTRSFGNDTELERPPDQFDRRLVGQLRTLDRQTLQGHLESLLSNEQIDSLLDRRDALLDHLDKLIAERGEAQVLF